MTDGLTERQRKWFATARANMVRDTGRSWDDWLALARTCPHARMSERKAWLIEQGLPSGKAMMIVHGAWEEQGDLADALWRDAQSRQILNSVDAVASGLPGVVTGQRKSFTAWSRTFQFAALRPVKGGGALLGLALEGNGGPSTPRRESWSERLLTTVALNAPADVDAGVEAMLRQAWERS